MAYQYNDPTANPGDFNLEYDVNTSAGPSQGRNVTLDDIAAPFSQEEINSFQAGVDETVMACIRSLGPQPAVMTPEYIYWAFQQIVEPIPGFYMTIGEIATALSSDMMNRMNAFNVEYAPRNMQIITGQPTQPTQPVQPVQPSQSPQQTNAPQWHLIGTQRHLIDCNGTEFESYQCSDGHWRILQGDELESARSRTRNLQAPVRPPIPRTAPLQAPVARVAAPQTPSTNGVFGDASGQTAHFQ